MSEPEQSQHILLLEPNPGISRMLAFSLESQFGMNAIETVDSASAIQLLSSVTEINLVVIGDYEKHLDLLTLLSAPPYVGKVSIILGLSDKLKDPSILFSPGVLGVAHRTSLVDDVLKLIGEKFYQGEVIETPSESDFCRIRTQLLLFAYPLAADVYIRLSARKYLKIFRQGDPFEESDFDRYAKEKRIDYFYIRQGETMDFISSFKREADKLLSAEKVEPAVLQSVAAGIHDTIRNIIQTLGVTEEVRTLTKSNVDLVMKKVGRTPRLNDIFKRLQTESSQYIVSHSVTLGEIACILAGNIDWLSDVTFKKLILAALFHDITIKNHELAKIRTYAEAQKFPELFVLETPDDFKKHPLRAAEMVNLLDDVPSDVDAIIRQHHERPDGSGFPTGLTAHHLSPLSCILIIAHDFVDYSMETPGKPDFLSFLKEYKNQYTVGYFKRIAKTLEDKIREEQAREERRKTD